MSDLTPEQHKLINFIMAEGIRAERERIMDLINSFDSDTIDKPAILKLIDGE